MGKMQVTYAGTQLDNTTWRKITGTFADQLSADHTRYVVVEFTIEADDTATLHARKLQTETEFLKRNELFVATLDDTGTGYFARMAPNDGVFLNVITSLDVHPTKGQTGNSLYMLLTCAAQRVAAPDTIGDVDQNGDPVFGPPYVGALDTITSTKIYNSGRVVAQTVEGSFVSTFDDAAVTSLTISSVETASGKARFVFSGSPALGAYETGSRLEVSGSAAYNGVHIVTAVDDTTDKITTTTAFTATDTGTATLGKRDSGRTNYDAARTDLLARLGVGADGQRGADGQTLTVEQVAATDTDETQVNFVLVAEFQPYAFSGSPDVRKQGISIQRVVSPRWDVAGGEKPIMLRAVGFVEIDHSQNDDPPLQVFYSTIMADVEAAVVLEANDGEVKLLEQTVVSEAGESRVAFNLLYQAANADTLSFSKSVSFQSRPEYVVHDDAEGFHYAQKSPAPPRMIITKTVSRVGLGLAVLDLELSPEEKQAAGGDGGGFTFVAWPDNGSIEGPLSTDFGENVYVQTLTRSYERLKFKAGGTVEVVPAPRTGR